MLSNEAEVSPDEPVTTSMVENDDIKATSENGRNHKDVARDLDKLESCGKPEPTFHIKLHNDKAEVPSGKPEALPEKPEVEAGKTSAINKTKLRAKRKHKVTSSEIKDAPTDERQKDATGLLSGIPQSIAIGTYLDRTRTTRATVGDESTITNSEFGLPLPANDVPIASNDKDNKIQLAPITPVISHTEKPEGGEPRKTLSHSKPTRTRQVVSGEPAKIASSSELAHAAQGVHGESSKRSSSSERVSKTRKAVGEKSRIKNPNSEVPDISVPIATNEEGKDNKVTKIQSAPITPASANTEQGESSELSKRSSSLKPPSRTAKSASGEPSKASSSSTGRVGSSKKPSSSERVRTARKAVVEKSTIINLEPEVPNNKLPLDEENKDDEAAKIPSAPIIPATVDTEQRDSSEPSKRLSSLKPTRAAQSVNGEPSKASSSSTGRKNRRGSSKKSSSSERLRTSRKVVGERPRITHAESQVPDSNLPSTSTEESKENRGAKIPSVPIIPAIAHTEQGDSSEPSKRSSSLKTPRTVQPSKASSSRSGRVVRGGSSKISSTTERLRTARKAEVETWRIENVESEADNHVSTASNEKDPPGTNVPLNPIATAMTPTEMIQTVLAESGVLSTLSHSEIAKLTLSESKIETPTEAMCMVTGDKDVAYNKIPPPHISDWMLPKFSIESSDSSQSEILAQSSQGNRDIESWLPPADIRPSCPGNCSLECCENSWVPQIRRPICARIDFTGQVLDISPPVAPSSNKSEPTEQSPFQTASKGKVESNTNTEKDISDSAIDLFQDESSREQDSMSVPYDEKNFVIEFDGEEKDENTVDTAKHDTDNTEAKARFGVTWGSGVISYRREKSGIKMKAPKDAAVQHPFVKRKRRDPCDKTGCIVVFVFLFIMAPVAAFLLFRFVFTNDSDTTDVTQSPGFVPNTRPVLSPIPNPTSLPLPTPTITFPSPSVSPLSYRPLPSPLPPLLTSARLASPKSPYHS